MRRLFRFAGLIAGIGAVAYLMRDRMVRIPEEPTPPPHFRRASPNGEAKKPREAAIATLADDLTEITGIGPVFAKRLNDAGITSFAQLADADVAATAQEIGVGSDQIAHWVSQARQRL